MRSTSPAAMLGRCPSLKTIIAGFLKSIREISATSRFCRCPSLKTMTTDPWSSADAAPVLAIAPAAANMVMERIQNALTVLRMVALLPSHEDRNTLLPEDGTWANADLFHVPADGFKPARGTPAGQPPGRRRYSLRRALRRFLQVSQHLSRMAFRLYFGKDVLDLPVGPDDERRPHDTHHFLSVHVLLLKHTEGVGDLLVGVGQQREGQLEFLLKLLLRLGRVGR